MSAIPTRPEDLSLNAVGERLELRWHGGADTTGSSYIMYNVYTSKESPVDITDGRNLIARRLTRPQLTIGRDDGAHFYAVTAIDRYGNESAPLQSDEPWKSDIEWLKNDGRQLVLPPIDPALDAYYVCVESMQGNVLMTRLLRDKTLNIRGLHDGVYTLKVMTIKKKAYRVGQFIIKR